MDAIAVVLALEDYQNSIAKNLIVRDVAVDIYGVAMVFPPGEVFPTRLGERFFFTRRGREFIGLPDRGRDFFLFFFKAKQYKLINEDLVSGGSRI